MRLPRIVLDNLGYNSVDSSVTSVTNLHRCADIMLIKSLVVIDKDDIVGAQYDKPPIIEVVAEFRFANASWTTTIPGRFAERIKDNFTELLPSEDGEPTLDHGIWEGRSLFKHTSHDVLVQLGEGFLVVNNVTKYITWANLLPLVKGVYSSYKPLIKTQQLQHIVLRYINQIDIPHHGTEIVLQDYFNLYPFYSSLPYEMYTGFMVGIQFPFDNGNIKVELRTANTDAPEVTSVILDMECVVGNIKDSSVKTVISKLNLAHDKAEQLFESIIKDATRQLFFETYDEGVDNGLPKSTI